MDFVTEAPEKTMIPDPGPGTPIRLIGAPTDVGAGRRGCCLGPEALRIAGLVDCLRGLGLEVQDGGDLAGPPNPLAPVTGGYRHLREARQWCQLVRDAVTRARRAGALPVVLGGDHSVALGSITAMTDLPDFDRRPLHVLWLDAHTDYNTPQTSPSGNIHGMPLAALTGREGLSALSLTDEAAISADRTHLFGIRSIDRAERAAVIEGGAHIYDMRTIDERSVVATMREILARVGGEGGRLHVSLDLDFLDPVLAPGVGTAVPGGATFREAHLCMELIHESGLLASLDLVELNPILDVRGCSGDLLVDLTGSLFGRKIVDSP